MESRFEGAASDPSFYGSTSSMLKSAFMSSPGIKLYGEKERKKNFLSLFGM